MSALRTALNLAALSGASATLTLANGIQIAGTISQASETQQWISEIENRITAIHCERVAPLLEKGKRSVHDLCHADVFPINVQTDPHLWERRGSIWMAESWDDQSGSFLLNGVEVPDFLYGFLNVDNNTGLPEDGTAEDFKEGILAVLEDSACEVLRRVTDLLGSYDITVQTSEVDLVDKRVSIHCTTDRPVMQVNGIMGNKKIREIMPRRARVCINTFVEEHRRTDDYLEPKEKPVRQVVQRTFWFENGRIERAEPEHWSAGSCYEPGDVIRIGSVAMRVEEQRDYPDPDAGFEPVERRPQGWDHFRAGIGAYQQAARHR